MKIYFGGCVYITKERESFLYNHFNWNRLLSFHYKLKIKHYYENTKRQTD